MSHPRAPRAIGKIFRAILVCLILAVNVIVIWRMCSSGDPKAVRTVTPNEALISAYRATDGNLTAYRQEQATITRAVYNYGYFSVTRCVFFPEAHQVQLVVRYNKSTLRHLAEDKQLAEIPPKSGTHFDVTLVRTTDLTPDDPADNDDPLRPETRSETRFSPSGEPVRVETSLYTYLRYTFDGVDVEPDTLGVLVDIYWLGDLDYSARPYGTLCVWDSESNNVPYRLTKADRRALGG